MTTNTKPPSLTQNKEPVPYSERTRLPYYPQFKDRFDIDQGKWAALINACYPNAMSVGAIVMVLDYCKARGLDPFKKPVSIVPMYSKQAKGYVETIWPGINEIRTTAHRTKEYAGIDRSEYGPDKVFKFEHRWEDEGRQQHTQIIEVIAPEYVAHTVYRMVHGQRCAFHGPRVYWIEAYAAVGRGSDVPNQMWQDRPRGQLEKVSEAATLRLAFPEEIGNEYTAEEMEGKTLIGAGPVLPSEQATARTPIVADAPTNGGEQTNPVDTKPDTTAAKPARKKTPPPAVKSTPKLDPTPSTTQTTEGGDENTSREQPPPSGPGEDNAQPAPSQEGQGAGSSPVEESAEAEENFRQYINDLREAATIKAVAKIREDILSDELLTDQHRIGLRQPYADARARVLPTAKKAQTEAPRASADNSDEQTSLSIPGMTDGKFVDMQATFEWVKGQMESRKGDGDALTKFWTETIIPIAGDQTSFFYRAVEEMWMFYSNVE